MFLEPTQAQLNSFAIRKAHGEIWCRKTGRLIAGEVEGGFVCQRCLRISSFSPKPLCLSLRWRTARPCLLWDNKLHTICARTPTRELAAQHRKNRPGGGRGGERGEREERGGGEGKRGEAV